VRLAHPHDGQAMRRYTERYEYDAVGNFLRLIHQALNGSWTREYAYKEPSLIEPAKTSNRLSRTTVGATPETYSHDTHGNMTRMPHLPLMQWDFKDQLQATAQQVVNNGGTPETTYYVYDSAGQRVRKVTELGSGQVKDERIYLGGFEIYKKNGANPLVRETLHIMDDQQRIALVETRTQGSDPAPQQLIRYQFGNHLGSASLELDDQAQIISYEEYTPYGSTAYQAVRKDIEVTLKRYRYTGKERDEESGLYYHGARYYAPWIGRWVSPDKVGLGDGIARFTYVHDRPTIMSDPSGNYAEGGHYYTVYFVSLAAGFDPKTAQLNAAFAQMPDEVKQLDAIEVQKNRLLLPRAGMVRWLSEIRDLIQRALHALTGESSATERKKTRDAISQTTPGTLEFGFLLHRFGDTYAHTMMDDESRTYKTGPGHLRHFHAPDQIHQRPGLYQEYVKDLYNVLSAAAKAQGYSPRLSAKDVSDFAEKVGQIRVMKQITFFDPETKSEYVLRYLDVEATERAQIQLIRELSEKYMMGMTDYTPEKEATMSWDKYKQT
jgi:RHS repeat-associated protein